MLNLAILEDQQKVQTHQDTINRTMQQMAVELSKIDRESLKDEIVVQKEREARKKYEPLVREQLKAITDLANQQRQVMPFWENAEYVASMVPVTEALAGNVPFMPKDADKELSARTALAQEYARMDAGLLALHFRAAQSKGEIGKCYLMDSINRRRENPASFGLSSVEIPHQAAVLDVMQATRGAKLAAENSWRESNGTRVSAAAKLAAGYEAAGPVKSQTSEERLHQRAIDEGRA